MECCIAKLEPECLDVSGGVFDLEIYEDEEDFSNDANAELIIGNRIFRQFTLDSGLSISDFDGYPKRYIRLVIDEIPTAYTGYRMKLVIRPYDEVKKVYEKPLNIVNYYAKRTTT